MGENGGSCVLRILMQLNKLYSNLAASEWVTPILRLEKKRQVQLLWKEGLVKCRGELWLTKVTKKVMRYALGRVEMQLEGKLET